MGGGGHKYEQQYRRATHNSMSSEFVAAAKSITPHQVITRLILKSCKSAIHGDLFIFSAFKQGRDSLPALGLNRSPDPESKRWEEGL